MTGDKHVALETEGSAEQGGGRYAAEAEENMQERGKRGP